MLERMIPYLDMTAPHVEGPGGGLVATGMAPIYRSVASRDQFRNLVRTHRLFKSAQKSVYEATLARVVALRAGTAAELSRATQ